MAALAPFVPMMLGVAGGAFALLLGAWGRRGAAVVVALAGLSAGAFSTGLLALRQPTATLIGSGGAYALPVVACLVFAAVAVAASLRTLASSNAGSRIAALCAFAGSAAALVSVSLDLGMLFLSVEALALCGYGLVALGGTDRAREAAMKWFVQGSVATAVFIVGIAVLLSATGGSLSYGAIAVVAQAGVAPGLSIGIALVLIAVAFKAGAFPFHSWMPDAFETAPAPGVAVLASAGKVAPMMAMVFLAAPLAGRSADAISGVAALLATGSIVFGNLAALRQRSVARMLAYSGIAQVGYALVGVTLGQAGTGGVLIFAVLYGLTSVASFVFIVALRETDPDWDGTTTGLAGLGARRPVLAASLTVIMLSLTGIPLTAGFWGKLLVFAAAATQGYLWLAVVAVLGSVVSFGYYGGVLRSAFFDDALAGEGVTVPRIPASFLPHLRFYSTIATALLALFLVIIGILPFVSSAALPIR